MTVERVVPQVKDVITEGRVTGSEIVYVKDTSHKDVFVQLREDLAFIGYKVIDVVVARRQAETNALEKKKVLKAKADVAMEVDEAGPSKETISAAVKAE
ncbi:hypothetical protein FS749_011599, partial [Ceratobasidium sp. UAMH 11750]